MPKIEHVRGDYRTDYFTPSVPDYMTFWRKKIVPKYMSFCKTNAALNIFSMTTLNQYIVGVVYRKSKLVIN